ncbi:CHAT domain-containing protein [Streptomyces sp. NBS 14/10]|uniref:CHAT domain-containing protein n=1 Tax=Streptomyces sp. NBS 14/10 TaxID=1945643 RepID=UPI000B7FE088|nr:CHAT domain-containing protein [Streptomyces sp. NBS 14/10]KAK1185313.1 CHAT domain-containing protein [Streptomyces sp. NBS 14/10]
MDKEHVDKEHNDGGDRASVLRAWADIATRHANEVMRRPADDPARRAALWQSVQHLAAIARLLPADDPLRDDAIASVGILVSVWLDSRGPGRQNDAVRSAREYALYHLRWADRTRPLTDPLAVQARKALLWLLIPEHYARAMRASRQGPTSSARQEPPPRAADPRALTVSRPDELAEAMDVLRRLAEAPEDPQRLRLLGSVVSEIKLTVSQAVAPHEENTTEPTGTAPPEDADDPLADAVQGVLAWALEDIPRLTGLLVWLSSTVYEVRISTGKADEEVAALGLDRPVFAPLRELLAKLRSGEGDPRALADGARRSADVARCALRELPADVPERARMAKLHAALLLQANFFVPGTMDFDEVDEAVSEPDPEPAGGFGRPGQVTLEQWLTSLIDAVRVQQTGDLAHLERGAARLREMIDGLSGEGDKATTARQAVVGALAGRLDAAATLGGSFQAADAALTMARDLRAAYRDNGAPPSTSMVNAVIFASYQELALARRNDDPTVLPRLVEELTALYTTLPPDQENRFAIAAILADAHREQVNRTQDPAELRAAARYFRDVVETDQRQMAALLAPYFPALRADAMIELLMIDPSREAADRAVAEVHRILEGPQPTPHQELRLRSHLGRVLLHTARHLDDPVLLDQSIAELSRVRELIGQGHGLPHTADALTQLSEAYWLRRERHRPTAVEDVNASLATRGEALIRLALDVLLQLGSEHGLAVARTGSAQALWLAYWNTVCFRPADAVHALELGRALVLRAAAASRGIPELLEARGHPDLARQWRAEVAADRPPTDTAAPLLGRATERQIPGTLRRRALDALGAGSGADARKLLGLADLAGLKAGLTTTGTDALVYLVLGLQPGQNGFALILRPDTGDAPPTVLKLPLLTPGSPPLERYLDVTARRSQATAAATADATAADATVEPSGQAALDREWEAALRELCDWAWPAAMGPVLAAVGPLNRPPRIVLVPCGALGAVAWHAARTPYGRAGRAHRYACEEAVLSYAPSGAEFLRAGARDRLPIAAGQVLVADPELSLLWAEIETEALRAACYPDGLCYGEFPTAVSDAPGTPEDILAVLPGGSAPAAAVLHISCHALVGPYPTRSALWLATPPDGPQDAGRLTVARILDGTATGAPDAAGPLVVLSACETDLSTRNHDEALTLSTALIARGAADVIGSRWAVRDASTAVMMAVFHDFVTAHALAPVDALRAAQLWMLDPHREPPPTLHDDLRGEAARIDLDQVHFWAAFTHQGNPAAQGTE